MMLSPGYASSESDPSHTHVALLELDLLNVSKSEKDRIDRVEL